MDVNIGAAEAAESKKIAQKRAVDLRMRKENRAFMEKASKSKSLAQKDSKTKLLAKTLEQTRALVKELNKAHETHSKEEDTLEKAFENELNALKKKHEQKMNAFCKVFNKKLAPKRKQNELLGNKMQKLQDELNEKYQDCFVTYNAEVRRILTPFIRDNQGVHLKDLPVVKKKLIVQAEELQNDVDEFIINTETLNEPDLSKAIDEFIE